jgi:predicted nucleic acid-binding protein
MLYLDTSALVKLVTREAESVALQSYLADRSDVRWLTSGLTRAELLRAAFRSGVAQAVDDARTVLATLDILTLTDRLLDQAGVMPPAELRTLDAIHLAAAKTVGPQLTAVVTYDARMVDAARQAGLPVARPGAASQT